LPSALTWFKRITRAVSSEPAAKESNAVAQTIDALYFVRLRKAKAGLSFVFMGSSLLRESVA
jgi:hypothetical protein